MQKKGDLISSLGAIQAGGQKGTSHQVRSQGAALPVLFARWHGVDDPLIQINAFSEIS